MRWNGKSYPYTPQGFHQMWIDQGQIPPHARLGTRPAFMLGGRQPGEKEAQNTRLPAFRYPLDDAPHDQPR